MAARMECSDAAPLFLSRDAGARRVVFVKARQQQINDAARQFAHRQQLAARFLAAADRAIDNPAFRAMWKAKAVKVSYQPSRTLGCYLRRPALAIVDAPPHAPRSFGWLVALLALVAAAIAVTPVPV